MRWNKRRAEIAADIERMGVPSFSEMPSIRKAFLIPEIEWIRDVVVPSVRASRFWPLLSFLEDYPLSLRWSAFHQAYHVLRWSMATGKDPSQLESILEFGGGSGEMAVIMRRLGFQGRYRIFDFPELHQIQRHYLEDVRGVGGVEYLEEVPTEGADLLVGLYSLSEAPVDLRDRFLLLPFGSFLIAYQEKYDGFNNRAYFSSRGFEPWGAHSGLPDRRYTFGRLRRKLSSVSVLVLSCDRYAWAWRSWATHWAANASGIFGPVYFATGSQDPTAEVGDLVDVRPILTGQENWTKNARDAVRYLERVHGADRVLLMLEDFWAKPRAREIPWESLRVLDVPMMGLHPHSSLYASEDIWDVEGVPLGFFRPGSRYSTCLQPTVWRPWDFVSLVRFHESPWEFEWRGGKRGEAKGLSRYFYGVDWYAHGVRRGRLTKEGKGLFVPPLRANPPS